MSFRFGVLSKSMLKTSCSSSIRWLTLLLLSARSMLVLPADPFDSVLVGAGAPFPRAASSFVRCSSCVSMLMLACRGGLLRPGLNSPFDEKPAECDVGKEESRKGEPTWPRPSRAAFCENIPEKRDPGLPDKCGEVWPDIERREAAKNEAGLPSSWLRDDLDSFLALISGIRSCRLDGSRSSSLSESAPSSSSEDSMKLPIMGGRVPKLADMKLREARSLSECRGRFSNEIGSSVPLGGEDPMLAIKLSIPRSPKAEVRKSRRAVLPSCEFRGREEGGESRFHFEGTDAAKGPLRAAKDMPLLSKEFGRGASSTDSPF